MSKLRSESPHLAKALGGRVLPSSSSQSHGLLNRFAQQASIKVSLAEKLVYLFPKPQGAIPDHDNSIEGTVTLTVPKPKTLKTLQVKLTGKTDVQWTNRAYETFKSLEKTVELVTDNQGIHLEPGTHLFAFTILVPSNSAPSERCHWGRTRYTVSALAKGLASFGGDLAHSVEIFFVVNPGCARPIAFYSEPPPPLHYKMVGVDDVLGPWSVVLQSQHLMVGGALQLKVNIASPPSTCSNMLVAIQSIKVKVVTRAHLNTPTHSTTPYSESPAPLHQVICSLTSQSPPNMGHLEDPKSPKGGPRSGQNTPRHGPLTVLSSGERYSISHVMRLITHEDLRPSTQPGTETCINLDHDVTVEIVHERIESDNDNNINRKGKNKARDATVMKISKPFTLWSCWCWLDSLMLPQYSEEDPNPNVSDAQVPCMCRLPNSTILKHHGELFTQPDREDDFLNGLADAVVVKVKAGQDDLLLHRSDDGFVASPTKDEDNLQRAPQDQPGNHRSTIGGVYASIFADDVWDVVKITLSSLGTKDQFPDSDEVMETVNRECGVSANVGHRITYYAP
ncbi:hypothetical protein OIO90_001994 [Microbotryomycetes sp. JL221]|nr:hypothetical protein OIO90_001994 [Microbotryomycetes sp. JL221]